jgi:Mrp family chromosome partitioning ATPase
MYDYIIVDTAPIALVTDTMVVNRLADMTLYCMRMGHTKKISLDTVQAIASRKSLSNMGILISQVGVGKLYYGGEKQSKGYGYGYGYGYGTNKKKGIFRRVMRSIRRGRK